MLFLCEVFSMSDYEFDFAGYANSGSEQTSKDLEEFAKDAQMNIIYRCKIKTISQIHSVNTPYAKLYTRELYSVGDTLYIGKYEPES